MNTGVLEIGSRAIVKKRVRKDEMEYTTQIQNIESDKVRILTPMYKSVLIRLQEGTRIELSVFSGSKLYEFDAEVIESVVEGNLYYTDILATSKIVKIERRDYFRVKSMKDILLREKDQENPKEYSEGLTIDLSGGGVQVSSTKVFSEADIIEMKMDVNNEEIQLDGEILSKIRQDGLGSYKYMIKFVELDKDIQELIVRHVFQIQRDNLRKDIEI